MSVFNKLLTLIFLTLFFNSLKSQSGLESILIAAEQDSKKIFQGYLQPALKSSIYLMNSGWYTTAKVHKKLGFDLTFSLNSAIIPSSVETFDISNLDMITSDSSSISTVFGNSESSELYVSIPSDGLRPEISTSFFSPKGIKEKLPLGMVSSPVIQASVGLPLKSELTLRYLPEYSRNNVYFSNYGIGFKHDLLQYFSFLKRIPTLNVSAFAAYSKMNIDYDIQSSGIFSGTNQMANFNISNYKLQILSSINLSIFEIYSGIGVNGGDSSFKIIGDYEIEYNIRDSDIPYVVNLNDPIDINYSIHELSKNIGIKFKFLFLHVFVDYTFQEFDVVTAGVSLNFR